MKLFIIWLNRLIIGEATNQINQEDDTTRCLNGIIGNFSQGSRNPRFSFYNAAIVPRV